MPVTSKNFNTIVNYLAKNQPFVEATKTELGQELLKDMLNDMDILLAKIIDEKATELEKAEFRVLRKLSHKWIDRINKYTEVHAKFNEMRIKHERRDQSQPGQL